ncbi:hypothetical protein ACI0FM_02930 [Paenochrobactrum sp. BZR 588]|uniref:hypothetical protein n=1 Tax=unclassified Paenochrobactrum TaxID=2639760 RepID=UPI0038547AE0
MTALVRASTQALPFADLEDDICRTKNSVGLLQRLIEDTVQPGRLTVEDGRFIHYAAINALREVSELHAKFYAAMEVAA